MPKPLFSHLLPLTQRGSLPIQFINTTGQITQGVQCIVADTTSGNITLTLPPTQSLRGQYFYFVKQQVANVLTIAAGAGDQITYAGAASINLNNRDNDALLLSDGAGVWIRLI